MNNISNIIVLSILLTSLFSTQFGVVVCEEIVYKQVRDGSIFQSPDYQKWLESNPKESK
jgi:hypothetical protein